ncbi:hypothetical protein HZS55_03060 [Halosimplex rubrum]|uniref:Uncharacterized protein n=1 Tax=Halosimplex rubrum TaxID=869889 RepID=A0A7D5NYC1_9EURY|nr:hypothetical protein [Halosimplex rubrum]QLH76343.1 hypothetical protein HZS55_03060 [Halosimplex rubrum]
MVSEVTRRRAQMILIGAVTFAAVIIGLTVIINSYFVTQSGVVSDVSPQIDEANEFEYESRKGVRSLVVRLNHRHRNLSATDLATVISRNTTVYRDLMAESYASSRGEYVTVSYVNDSSQFGSRVVQSADANVTSNPPANQSEWVIGRPAETSNLGWFTMNVNVQETSETPMWINVTNASSHWVNVSMHRTTAGSGENLRVTSNVSSAGNTSTLCDPSRDRVLLDLVDGSAFTSDCRFNATTAIAPPYRVSVSGGENAVAKYELVYNETADSAHYEVCDSSVARTQPCRTPAVWVANVTTQFSGSELTYANEYNITVYEEAR